MGGVPISTAKRRGRNRWIGYVGGTGTVPDGALHASPADVARWLEEGRLHVVTPEDAPDDGGANAPEHTAAAFGSSGGPA